MSPQYRITPGLPPAPSCSCLSHRRPGHRDIPWRFTRPAPTFADRLVHAGDCCLAQLWLAAQVATGWLTVHSVALRRRLNLVANLSVAYTLLGVHWLVVQLARRLEARPPRSLPPLLLEEPSLPVVAVFTCAAGLIILLGWLQII